MSETTSTIPGRRLLRALNLIEGIDEVRGYEQRVMVGQFLGVKILPCQLHQGLLRKIHDFLKHHAEAVANVPFDFSWFENKDYAELFEEDSNYLVCGEKSLLMKILRMSDDDLLTIEILLDGLKPHALPTLIAAPTQT